MAKVATSVMRLNPLGSTNVMVSRLGLGMAALGRPGYINLGHGEDLGAARDVPTMEANARRVLDAAWSGTLMRPARTAAAKPFSAAGWKSTRSRPGPSRSARSGVIPIPPTGASMQRSMRSRSTRPPYSSTAAAEQRPSLGECLNICQIQSATFDSGVLGNQEVLDELARLKRADIAIGLTLSEANHAEVLRRARRMSNRP
jgi:hypothetical protein